VEEHNAIIEEHMVVRDILNAHTIREWVTSKENCFSLHDFPDMTANIYKFEVVEPKFSSKEYENI